MKVEFKSNSSNHSMLAIYLRILKVIIDLLIY